MCLLHEEAGDGHQKGKYTVTERMRRRTMVVAGALPDEAVDWAPREGELTAGDILRHMAASQRMYLGLFLSEG